MAKRVKATSLFSIGGARRRITSKGKSRGVLARSQGILNPRKTGFHHRGKKTGRVF